MPPARLSECSCPFGETTLSIHLHDPFFFRACAHCQPALVSFIIIHQRVLRTNAFGQIICSIFLHTPCHCSITWSQLLFFLIFLICQAGVATVPNSWVRINELTYARYLKQCLIHKKYSINVNYSYYCYYFIGVAVVLFCFLNHYC